MKKNSEKLKTDRENLFLRKKYKQFKNSSIMEFLLKIKKSDMKQYDKDNNATVFQFV
jgi:hypothetical protein